MKKKIKPPKLSSKDVVRIMERFRSTHGTNSNILTKRHLVKQFKASTKSTQKFLINLDKKQINDSLFQYRHKNVAIATNLKKLSFKTNTNTGGLRLVASYYKEGGTFKVNTSRISRSIEGNMLSRMVSKEAQLTKLFNSGKIDFQAHKKLIKEMQEKEMLNAAIKKQIKSKLIAQDNKQQEDDDKALDPFDFEELDSQSFADMVNDPEIYAKRRDELRREGRARHAIKMAVRREKQSTSGIHKAEESTTLYKRPIAKIKKR